jgi:putative transposase
MSEKEKSAMTYNPHKHHLRSIRLKGYDYSQSGLYFITICTQNRACLFGKIENGVMILNDAGRMVETMNKLSESEFSGLENFQNY